MKHDRSRVGDSTALCVGVWKPSSVQPSLARKYGAAMRWQHDQQS